MVRDQKAVAALPKDWKQFSLSQRERAGVKENVTQG
jgi:hypothetical protein